MKTNTKTNVNENVGYLIRIIDNKLETRARNDLEELNLSLVQISVLLYIDRVGGTTTQKNIEDYLHISHPATKGIVTRLSKNKFVTINMDKDDKRQKNVSLTKKSLLILSKIQNKQEKIKDRMIKGVEPNDLNIFINVLNIMNNNLS